MSRIGKNPINIPAGVKAQVSGSNITIEGAKGKLSRVIHSRIKVQVKDNQIVVTRPTNSNQDRSLHGLTRNLIYNMVKGVSEGFNKELEIKGVGFRAQASGKSLNLQLGFSHPVVFTIPEGISIETPKPVQIVIKGIDKEKVGSVAAKIRSFYKPEPYKGKGIRYKDEYVRHKVGKAVA
ncbi:MAG: 50S ribosomal protein L6 [Candidatus Omnitrophota bacterium]|nr:MAG: 50S ribosomal protein L6 [Candidatus Omnitrophota bacterium]